MAELLDNKLGPGESVAWSPDVYNELVERLRSVRPAGVLDLELSCQSPLVRPGGGIEPESVAVLDATDYGSEATSRLKVVWSLSGPGHLSAPDGERTRELETGPGEGVEWSWSTSAEGDPSYVTAEWDAEPGGDSLPTGVQVSATLYRLTKELSGPSVEDLSDLSSYSASDGDLVQVRSGFEVYEYDPDASSGDVQSDSGGYWLKSSGESWQASRSTVQAFPVGRAHDPNRPAGGLFQLQAEQPALVLTGGSQTTRILDKSSFPASADRVTRVFSVAPEGASIAGAGGDLTGLSESSRKGEITISRPGTYQIEAEYTVETDSGERAEYASCQIQAIPAPSGLVGGMPRAPEVVEVTPGDGEVVVAVGQTFSVDSVTRLSSGSGQSGQSAEGVSPSRLAPLLSPGDVPGPEETIRQAADLLSSVQTGPVAERYEISLSGAARVGVGETIRFAGGEVRVEDVQSPEGGGVVVRGHGSVAQSAEYPARGWAAGSGSEIVLVAELSYGGGRKGMVMPLTLDPDAGRPVARIPLPQASPAELGDKWMISGWVGARFAGTDADKIPIPSQPAETVPPSGTATIALTETVPGLCEYVLGGGGGSFHGKLEWVASGAADTRTADPVDALEGRPVPSREERQVPQRHVQGSKLVALGHWRASAGSCSSQLVKAVSGEVWPAGIPDFSEGAELSGGIPDVEAPRGTGTGIVQIGSQTFMSVGGEWIELGSARGAQVEVLSGDFDGLLLSGSQEGASSWTLATDFTQAQSDLLITAQLSGGVSSAELIGAAGSSFNPTTQKLTGRIAARRLSGGADFKIGLEATRNGSARTFSIRLVDQSESMAQVPEIQKVVLRLPNTSEIQSSETTSGYYSLSHSGFEGEANLRVFFENASAQEAQFLSGPNHSNDYFIDESGVLFLSLPSSVATEGQWVVEATGHDGSTKSVTIDITDNS